MALVTWLFAGGGETEIRCLVPFFRKHFPEYEFKRMTPVKRKPGPRPGVVLQGYGRTGKSLRDELKSRLKFCLSHERCDIILVLDDLDCRNEVTEENKFLSVIDSIDNSRTIKRFIGFAAPELEAWVIADWDNSVARHPDFRSRHERMRHWLRTIGEVSFDTPESFGNYDSAKDSCDKKLSDVIIKSTMTNVEDQNLSRYSKGQHTPQLLLDIDPVQVKNKCPLFAKWYHFLKTQCTN